MVVVVSCRPRAVYFAVIDAQNPARHTPGDGGEAARMFHGVNGPAKGKNHGGLVGLSCMNSFLLMKGSFSL